MLADQPLRFTAQSGVGGTVASDGSRSRSDPRSGRARAGVMGQRLAAVEQIILSLTGERIQPPWRRRRRWCAGAWTGPLLCGQNRTTRCSEDAIRPRIR
jgi:hypothetical protein